jgi:hypothetical protein
MTVTPPDTDATGEGQQTRFGDHATTYPQSWEKDDLPMPGSVTAAPGHEHANAVEQEYYLQDESDPVKKGDHKRKVLPRS